MENHNVRSGAAVNYFDFMADKAFKPRPVDGYDVVEDDWGACPDDTLTEYIRLNLPNEGRNGVG